MQPLSHDPSSSSPFFFPRLSHFTSLKFIPLNCYCPFSYDKENKTSFYTEKMAWIGPTGLSSLIPHSALVLSSPFSAFFSSCFFPPGSSHMLLYLSKCFFFYSSSLYFLLILQIQPYHPFSRKVVLNFCLDHLFLQAHSHVYLSCLSLVTLENFQSFVWLLD